MEDEREPDKPSPALETRVKEAEARRLLKAIRPEDHVVALWHPGSYARFP